MEALFSVSCSRFCCCPFSLSLLSPFLSPCCLCLCFSLIVCSNATGYRFSVPCTPSDIHLLPLVVLLSLCLLQLLLAGESPVSLTPHGQVHVSLPLLSPVVAASPPLFNPSAALLSPPPSEESSTPLPAILLGGLVLYFFAGARIREGDFHCLFSLFSQRLSLSTCLSLSIPRCCCKAFSVSEYLLPPRLPSLSLMMSLCLFLYLRVFSSMLLSPCLSLLCLPLASLRSYLPSSLLVCLLLFPCVSVCLFMSLCVSLCLFMSIYVSVCPFMSL